MILLTVFVSKHTDKKDEKYQVKEMMMETKEKILKSEENTNDVIDELKVLFL